jgi:hypothetical protein
MLSNENEIWNEQQWENHLNEMEHKSEKLRVYIETNLGEQSPRWSRFLNGFPSKLDAIDAYIEDELMFEDAYFPDDDDDWDEDEEEVDDFFLSADETEEEDDMEDGEDWKKHLDPDSPLRSEYSPAGEENEQDIAIWIANQIIDDSEEAVEMEIYDEARELAADMLRLAEIVPQEEQDDKFIELVTDTVNVGSKVAGAFAFGFDLDVLGGNIAYCKKALGYANRVLELLQELKYRPFMRYVVYETLHERMFDLRNDLGVHIQELRSELNEGLASE